MKSSQLMSRIEAAGWRRIRGEGSHFTYERQGKRALYAYGRPQTEVGKHNLREIEKRFNLVEIERETHDKRVEASLQERLVAATKPQVSVKSEDKGEMTDQVARLLFAQLHRDHKMNTTEVGRATRIGPNDLVEYFHHARPLKSSDLRVLWAWLETQERTLGLVRDRNLLLKKGYGARTGATNSRDPFIDLAVKAIRAAMVGGNTASDIARAIGVNSSVVNSMLKGRSKTIFPGNKSAIQKWIAENEMIEPEPVQPVKEEVKGEVFDSYDQELVAIHRVREAIKGLNHGAAIRALRYVIERVE